jgi:hypothetical protein
MCDHNDCAIPRHFTEASHKFCVHAAKSARIAVRAGNILIIGANLGGPAVTLLQPVRSEAACCHFPILISRLSNHRIAGLTLAALSTRNSKRFNVEPGVIQEQPALRCYERLRAVVEPVLHVQG